MHRVLVAVQGLSNCRLLNYHATCGVLVPWPGIKPASLELESRLLTTGPSGKSLNPSRWSLVLGGVPCCRQSIWDGRQLPSAENAISHPLRGHHCSLDNCPLEGTLVMWHWLHFTMRNGVEWWVGWWKEKEFGCWLRWSSSSFLNWSFFLLHRVCSGMCVCVCGHVGIVGRGGLVTNFRALCLCALPNPHPFA